MKTYEECEILKNNISTFKETSLDSDSEVETYMSMSEHEVVNFDKVKKQYSEKLRVKEPCSCDAYYQGINGQEYFVGLLMYCDIMNCTVSDCRKKLHFILVYNENKNGQAKEDSAKIKIGKYFSKKGKKELIRFDLERYQDLYFKSVHTYTEDEFESFLEGEYK